MDEPPGAGPAGPLVAALPRPLPRKTTTPPPSPCTGSPGICIGTWMLLPEMMLQVRPRSHCRPGSLRVAYAGQP